MKLNRACAFLLLSMQCVLVSQGVHAAGFSGRACVVRGRAIVFYDNKLFVAEPGTAVISKYNEHEAFARITGQLTHHVHLIRNLDAIIAKGSRDMVAVQSRLTLDGFVGLYYFSPTDKGEITLTKDKPEEGALWREARVGGGGVVDTYHTREFTFEHQRLGRFIVVSSDKTVIKGRDGTPLTLYALKLGEKGETKEAAIFQTVTFSGP